MAYIRNARLATVFDAVTNQNALSTRVMNCKRCDRVFANEERVASISGSIMGDEHTDVYYFCPACQVYTVSTIWDDFTGVESTTVSGPLSKTEGDERVSLILKCPEPWEKKCRCAAHVAYFRGTLD